MRLCGINLDLSTYIYLHLSHNKFLLVSFTNTDSYVTINIV